jgi:hypothetical protein
MKNKVFYFIGVLVLVAASVIWISCGGGSGGSGSSSTGSVALYATDDMSVDYKQVTATVNKVSLVQTGTGDTCDLLTTPVTLDITDLSSMVQLLDVAACPAVDYNRIHIEFSEQSLLTDTGDVTATCNFTSYKDKGNNPNVLQCDAGNCSLDINGAVNVFANQRSKLALDFNLKKFDVQGFNTPGCSVTMKVSPLNSAGIKGKHYDGYEEGISGNVSNLDISAKSFTLSAKSGDFTVFYSSVITAGIDNVLILAETDGLKAIVRTSAINLDTGVIDASAIDVKVDGTVSILDTLNQTFTLSHNTDTIPVDYSGAEEVKGVLINGASAELKLNGYDGFNYLAREVKVGVN